MDKYRSGQPKILLPDYDSLVSMASVAQRLPPREGIAFLPPHTGFLPPSSTFTVPDFLTIDEENERGIERVIRGVQAKAYELAIPAASIPQGYEPPFPFLPALAFGFALYVARYMRR